MKKSYLVDAMHSDMRLDKWIKAKIGKFPQSLIERNLRNGKIKINKLISNFNDDNSFNFKIINFYIYKLGQE